MIATPPSLEPARDKSNYRPSPTPDQVAKKSGLPKAVAANAQNATAAVDKHHDSRNKKFIKNCIQRLTDSRLFGTEHVKAYLCGFNRRGCCANTLRGNFSAIYLFLLFLKGLGRSSLDTVVRDDLAAFVEHEQDRGLKPYTVFIRLRFLYAFFSYLIERDVACPDLIKKKMRIKVPDTLPRAIDPQDISKLLSVINHIRNRAMIIVLLRTGIRIGELLGLRCEDVNLREKRIEIFEARKTRTGRVVYLSDDARGALRVWLKKRDAEKSHIFYTQGRSTMSYETARTMFKKYLDKAGLSHKGFTLHCLRHTFASVSGCLKMSQLWRFKNAI